MKPAVSVRNLGKRYRLGLTHARSLNELAARWTARMRGAPIEKAGLDRVEAARTTGGDFWALKDINFEVTPGEVVGIIGRNGAGKSTLLKILSRVTRPTTGQVDLRGRVGSLLEVGTGFHPELTGRENVYMNGTLLGMTKREVDRRFDEIVDFAGVDRFIDTPVKRYSSGMKVRLGFAVAAYLEPEILVVDEVLAVGDAQFQKKCLGKMSDVASHGRTVLFVSHNMAAVRTLTKRCVLLQSGQISELGETSDVLGAYARESLQQRQGQDNELEFFRRDHEPAPLARITRISVGDRDRRSAGVPEIESGTPITIRITIRVMEDVPSACIAVVLTKDYETVVTTLFSPDSGMDFRLAPGTRTISCEINSISLVSGSYSVTAGINTSATGKPLDVVTDVPAFDIVMSQVIDGNLSWPHRPWGVVHLPSVQWESAVE